MSGEVSIKVTDLLSYEQAAGVLNISRPTLYNKFLKPGRLHPVGIAGRRFLLRKDVELLRDELAIGRTD